MSEATSGTQRGGLTYEMLKSTYDDFKTHTVTLGEQSIQIYGYDVHKHENIECLIKRARWKDDGRPHMYLIYYDLGKVCVVQDDPLDELFKLKI